MAYKCPRCGEAVKRGSSKAGEEFGAVGILFSSAFSSFECKKCGKIPKKEFSSEDRQKMAIGSFWLLVGAIALGIAVIWFLIEMGN